MVRFSPIALGCVVAIALTGVVQAIVEVGSFGALVDTGFGRAVLAKGVLLAALIGLGWANRSRLLPALRRLAAAAAQLGRAGRSLRRNLRAEVALIGGALVAAALMAGYSPPATESAGPVSGSEALADSLLEYTVEPAALGENEVHLYLFDAADGSQLQPREMSATASLPDRDIGPLQVDLRRAGPGHYVGDSVPFGVPGEWELDVEVRTTRFDQESAAIAVPIE